jgi:hypothetical protein
MQHCPPVYAVVFDTELLDEVPATSTTSRSPASSPPPAPSTSRRRDAEPFPEDTMPTYAYACTQCGHRFDAVQSFSDAA